jgi:hypothetical protein
VGHLGGALGVVDGGGEALKGHVCDELVGLLGWAGAVLRAWRTRGMRAWKSRKRGWSVWGWVQEVSDQARAVVRVRCWVLAWESWSSLVVVQRSDLIIIIIIIIIIIYLD